ncbi:2OG-Fe(II) oxygenase [Gracilaria domingensis]|nr:2OG-Fe(II) oxygenase [Gracilaria domingensis]
MPRPPDQTAGLYIVRGPDADVQKFGFPADHLAFQIGETAQILSGGLLRATPHAVKMPVDMHCISRVSFAVFLQPSPEAKLGLPALSKEQSQEALRTDDCIPALTARYQDGNTVGEFGATTFKAYYDWNGSG